MEKTLWQTSSPHPLMWSKNEIETHIRQWATFGNRFFYLYLSLGGK